MCPVVWDWLWEVAEKDSEGLCGGGHRGDREQTDLGDLVATFVEYDGVNLLSPEVGYIACIREVDSNVILMA